MLVNVERNAETCAY